MMIDGQKLTPFQNLILDTLNSVGGSATTFQLTQHTSFATKAITNSLRTLKASGFVTPDDSDPVIWSVVQ